MKNRTLPGMTEAEPPLNRVWAAGWTVPTSSDSEGDAGNSHVGNERRQTHSCPLPSHQHPRSTDLVGCGYTTSHSTSQHACPHWMDEETGTERRHSLPHSQVERGRCRVPSLPCLIPETMFFHRARRCLPGREGAPTQWEATERSL